MKTANAALVIAAGILLLIVIYTGRTKNISSAWNALMGTTASTTSSTGTNALGTSTLGSAAFQQFMNETSPNAGSSFLPPLGETENPFENFSLNNLEYP